MMKAMAWILDETTKPITYRRNPLQAVVTELKFRPVLKVPDKVPDYQDRIRDAFPELEERVIQKVHVETALGRVLRREDSHYVFRKTDQSAQVSLTSVSLALESSRYTNHVEFFRDFDQALKALLDVYRTVSATRLGLRYVNIVSRRKVSSDLGTDVGWSALLNQKLLDVAAPAVFDEATYRIEIRSPVGDGAMTLRHGIESSGADGPESYRLDIDRYVEDADLDLKKARSLLDTFSDDCLKLFQWAQGPKLKEWMES